MTTTVAATKELMQEYFRVLSGKPKDALLLNRYISNSELKQHILEAEAAFPDYELEVHQLIVEGDLAAADMTFRGKHQGAFAGIAPTGKTVTAGLMVFYRLADGKISHYSMQFDLATLLAQLQK